MSVTIWKYALEIVDTQVVEVPEGAMALHVDVQDDQLYVWVLLNAERDRVRHVIHIYGTGRPIKDDIPEVHVGSVQMGPFIWHVFWCGSEYDPEEAAVMLEE